MASVLGRIEVSLSPETIEVFHQFSDDCRLLESVLGSVFVEPITSNDKRVDKDDFVPGEVRIMPLDFDNQHPANGV